MRFSVIVPTYQRAEYLKRLLSCLQNQVFDHSLFEIIVVTDGVDNLSRAVLDEIRNSEVNLQCAALPARSGPAAARNYGVGLSKGEYLAFTDDDCQPDPAWLERFNTAIELRKGGVLSGTIHVPLAPYPTDYARNTAGLETAAFVTANLLIPKTIFTRLGGFDEAFKRAWREDSDYHFRCLEAGLTITRVDALVIHPIRAAPWGVSLKEQSKSSYDALLYKKHPLLYRRMIGSPPWNYYLVILLAAATFVRGPIGLTAGAIWVLMVAQFAAKRLAGNSKSFMHVLEMAVTSLLIPFLSVYWRLYGAFRYKVLFC